MRGNGRVNNTTSTATSKNSAMRSASCRLGAVLAALQVSDRSHEMNIAGSRTIRIDATVSSAAATDSPTTYAVIPAGTAVE
ncbi:MAG: hypothetical protein V7646_7775 [Pseudonocardia sp.]